MPTKFSDSDIARMIKERKPLPDNYSSRVQLREKRGHKERELDVAGKDGTQYRLILRQSDFNMLDFSIILAVSQQIRMSCFGLDVTMANMGNTQTRLKVTRFTISISTKQLKGIKKAV